MKNTKVKVIVQGGPVVNVATVDAASPDIVAISIDMKTKWCQFTGTLSKRAIGTSILHTQLCISPSADSCFIKKGKERLDTYIELPEYRGWKVHCANISRYTLRICFIKDEESDIARKITREDA